MHDTAIARKCLHCGAEMGSDEARESGYCCNGCKRAAEIITPETDRKNTILRDTDDHPYLERITLFRQGVRRVVQFAVPDIHCASCVQSIENLPKMTPGVESAEVNFPRKQVKVAYDEARLHLDDVLRSVRDLGFEPDVTSYADPGRRTNPYVLKLGVAGFCFGNIMLLSFPEYLGVQNIEGVDWTFVFGVTQSVLSLPVVFYAGFGYLKAAWANVKQRSLSLDFPIALGILILFLRSSWAVWVAGEGAFFDSLAGLVFFLLIGKWYQQKAYTALSFNRNYRDYFPLRVSKMDADGTVKATPLESLAVQDRIRLQPEEVVPGDAILESQHAQVDYSFVTGESDLVRIDCGDRIYAGGRIKGTTVILILQKKPDQSYLTELWKNEIFAEDRSREERSWSDLIGKYFTWGVLTVALATGIYWWWADMDRMWLAVTAVLIVACPCALALTFPFTYGSGQRNMGRAGLFLKEAGSIEKMGKVREVVFDKTGTLTDTQLVDWSYRENRLSNEGEHAARALAAFSTHPMARAYADFSTRVVVDAFREVKGAGISGEVAGTEYLLGSAAFTGHDEPGEDHSGFYVAVNGEVKAFVQIHNRVRQQMAGALKQLGTSFELTLLSGDSDRDADRFGTYFKSDRMLFRRSPLQKLQWIRDHQPANGTLLFLGDGLNDAGALRAADLGFAVTANEYGFVPACDGIIRSDKLSLLPCFMQYAVNLRKVIGLSFAISIAYNVTGLYFAVTGQLSPVIAAILMPASSISVVLITTTLAAWFARSIRSEQ